MAKQQSSDTSPDTSPAPKRDALQRLHDIRDDLNARIRGQRLAVEAYLATALAGEGMLYLGERGEAKTALAEAFAAYITDGTHRTFQLSKADTPDALFGPADPAAIMGGTFQRVPGHLPDCTSVVFDEFGKWNGVTRSALLRVQSERRFEGKALPMRFWMGVSNELIPELRGQADGKSAELGAFEESELPFWDRFTHMMFANQLPVDSDDWDAVVFEGCFEHIGTDSRLTVADIDTLQTATKLVAFPDTCRKSLKAIGVALRHEGVHVSTRKWRKATAILRAHALLDGRTEVKKVDMRWLEHCLWTTPDQRALISEAVSSIADRETALALAIEGRVAEFMVAYREKRLVAAEGVLPYTRVEPLPVAEHNRGQDVFQSYLHQQAVELTELIAKADEPEEAQRVHAMVCEAHAEVLNDLKERLFGRALPSGS